MNKKKILGCDAYYLSVVTFAFSTYADGAARRRMICPNFGGNMVTSVRESEEIVLVLPCTHGLGAAIKT